MLTGFVLLACMLLSLYGLHSQPSLAALLPVSLVSVRLPRVLQCVHAIS